MMRLRDSMEILFSMGFASGFPSPLAGLPAEGFGSPEGGVGRG
jgi:hypothetical protein